MIQRDEAIAQYLKDQGITVSPPPTIGDYIRSTYARRLGCPKCHEGSWSITPADVIMVDDKVVPIKLRCTDCGHPCEYKDLLRIQVG